MRTTAVLAALAALALTAAACSSDSNDAAEPTTTTEPATTVTPATTSGTPTTTAGLTGDGWTIGQLGVPAGPLDELFTAQRRGAAFATADVNQGGGVLGGLLTVSEVSPSRTQATEDLLPPFAAAGTEAFIGPVSSAEAAGVREVAAQQKLLGCSASASAAAVTRQPEEAGPNPSLFRTVIPDAALAAYLADAVTERRDTDAPGAAWKVSIVARGDDYGRSVSSALASSLEARGFVPQVVEYHPNTVIFGETAKDVAATGSDLNVLVSYEEGPTLLRALLDAGVPANRTVGLDAFFIPRLPDIVGRGAEAIDGFRVLGTTGDRAFLQRLEDDDPAGQVVYAAQAYDCAVVLALAQEAVDQALAPDLFTAVLGVTGGGRTCTTYADCLAKLRAGEDIDYDGPSGKLAIDDQGDPTFARFTTGTWQGGDLVEVSATDVDLARQAADEQLVALTATNAQIQLALRLLGFYDGPIDGVYDEQTRQAVAAFQASVGLPATGIYDAATDAALRARASGVASVLSTSTQELQQALTDLGFYSGPIDGTWNAETTAAMKALQASLGVPQTGVLDAATARALYERGVATGSATTTVPPTVPPTEPSTTPPPTEPPTAPPSTTPPPPTEPTLLEVLRADPDYSTLVRAIEVAGLDQVAVDPDDRYTIFAPTNAAFAALAPGSLDALLQSPTATRNLLVYHVGLGAFSTNQLKAGPLDTVFGVPLTITGSAATGDLRVDGARIVKPNAVASNGVVQGIDKVLAPPEAPS